MYPARSFRFFWVVSLMVFSASLWAGQSSSRLSRRNEEENVTRSAGAQDVLPFKAGERTLPNGLKVIVVPTGFPSLVSLQIPVQTGSRNEVEPGKSGFAHFFEHMMFRGTPAYPPDKYEEILTRAGARQNAYTSDDFTNYHVTFAKEDLETILRVEADRFQNLSYSQEAFKTEARAVLGEYNKNSANPLNKLFEVQRDHAFTTHPYRHTTMGFLKDIEDMPNQYDYSKIFFDRWYRPENTTLIVAGDVTAEQVFPLVEKYWGSWKSGKATVAIPREPAPSGPVYAHVPWNSPTLPWVTVAFHSPAFSERDKDFAAFDMILDLYFGPTSELYKKLVEKEQKADQFFAYFALNIDPALGTVVARLKRLEDARYVRDQILKTVVQARSEMISERRLEDAKSNARYGFVRTLDNTEAIASTLARFVRFRRSYNTLNNFYRVYASLTPEDLQAAARKYMTDARVVVTTLSSDSMPAEISKIAPLSSFEAASDVKAGADMPVLIQKTAVPQLNIKLLFNVGSADDLRGKEGLAQLAASMVAEAGSRQQSYDEIKRALFPIAGSFDAQVDKEMTTFTGITHRDNWMKFVDVTLPMLLEPGFFAEDFKRLKESQLNALKEDLRSSNEEELGRERLQGNIFGGTPYEHPVLGTVRGVESVTLEDVRNFIASHYTRGNLTAGLAGGVPDALVQRLKSSLNSLPEGKTPDPGGVVGKRSSGIEVEVIEKETRATAISFGHPIEVTRSHPDFTALWVARAWLGEHRSSMSHLYNRIREVRGMNYGDYAYIEAFPRGMFQLLPSPNVVRRAQIFEVWIRPLAPENAHMALRIAIHELEKLITNGLTPQQFASTRDYLMKNVFVMTATQDQQLGYALDSRWYGIGEFTSYMREQLKKLAADDVNRAIKKHLSAKDLSVVIITKDTRGLKEQLAKDAPSTIRYDAPKPADVLEEDKIIGARKLNIKAEKIRITPVEEVFK